MAWALKPLGWTPARLQSHGVRVVQPFFAHIAQRTEDFFMKSMELGRDASLYIHFESMKLMHEEQLQMQEAEDSP